MVKKLILVKLLIELMKRRRMKMIDIIVLILICVVLASFGQVYMKKGLLESGEIKINELLTKKIFSVVFQKNIFIGLILYLISMSFWLIVLSRTELSFAYPLIGLGYVLTAFLAKFYFNENITLIRLFGILLIISGAALIMKS